MPGPSPIYRPEFPAEFVEHARRHARQRTVAYQRRQRATPVLLLHADPVLSKVHAAVEVDLHRTPCGIGGNDGHRAIFSWKTKRDEGAKPGCSPLDHALVKAAACELIHETPLPLSRLSTTDITARAAAAVRGACCPMTSRPGRLSTSTSGAGGRTPPGR